MAARKVAELGAKGPGLDRELAGLAGPPPSPLPSSLGGKRHWAASPPDEA